MRAQILKPTPGNLALIAEVLLRGAPVAMPTETVYGLAANAQDPLALARIFETKERPIFDPLIVHVGLGFKRIEDLERANLVDGKSLSSQARETASRLMARFWPGPLTLVLPKNKMVPDIATSGLATVALRMPRHPVAQALIAASGLPLAAPSANRFGRISPTRAEDVAQELGERIDFIVDGGPCEIGVESTIVSIAEDGELTLLRPGGLSPEDIEQETGRKLARPTATTPAQPSAPGMLESHYAPVKPLFLLPESLSKLKSIPEEWKLPKDIGVLAIQGTEAEISSRFHTLTGIRPVSCWVLSGAGDLSEAAHHLFASLRALDQSKALAIIAEPCDAKTGLGHAIADRLQRASRRP